MNEMPSRSTPLVALALAMMVSLAVAGCTDITLDAADDLGGPGIHMPQDVGITHHDAGGEMGEEHIDIGGFDGATTPVDDDEIGWDDSGWDSNHFDVGPDVGDEQDGGAHSDGGKDASTDVSPADVAIDTGPYHDGARDAEPADTSDAGHVWSGCERDAG